MQDKLSEINPEMKFIIIRCIIHQNVLCKSVVELNHVIVVVIKVVIFTRARALDHRQFVALVRWSVRLNMVTQVATQL